MGVEERSWCSELQSYLTERFQQFCNSIAEPVPVGGLKIVPAFGKEEAKYFLLGLEANLFSLDNKAYVQSELLPAKAKGVAQQRMCQLFWRAGHSYLFREGVSQLATAATLILKHGLERGQVEMEPDIKRHGDLAYGVDILVKSKTGKLVLCVEVKRSTADLTKLVAGFRECCKRGKHAKAKCVFGRDHAKYEFCAFYKPLYFWAVAPDSDICFRMSYNDDIIELEKLALLPTREVMEADYE